MKDPYKVVIGVEIGKDFIRVAEVEHREGSFFLSRIAETDLEGLGIDDVVKALSVLVSEEGILSRVASVAIDTTLTERDTIQVDSELSEEQIVDFLKAEVDFHTNFSGEEFRTAYEIMGKPDDGHKEVFYAAIDANFLKTIRESCTRCGLSLQFVDLDHACTELAIKRLQKPGKNYIIVTVKEDQIEGSFCSAGERTHYKYGVYSGEPFYFITKMAQDLESLADKYAEKFYLAGPKADSFVLDLLRKSVDSRFELLALGKNINLSPMAAGNRRLTESPQYYSAVIGAALK